MLHITWGALVDGHEAHDNAQRESVGDVSANVVPILEGRPPKNCEQMIYEAGV